MSTLFVLAKSTQLSPALANAYFLQPAAMPDWVAMTEEVALAVVPGALGAGVVEGAIEPVVGGEGEPAEAETTEELETDEEEEEEASPPPSPPPRAWLPALAVPFRGELMSA